MNYTEIRKDLKSNGTISYSPELDIFTHHFPKSPLLPGALSGLLLAETCGGPDWSLRKIKGLRFRKPLTPNLAFMLACSIVQESPTEKTCAGKILSGTDTIADGEFVFTKSELSQTTATKLETKTGFWNSAQIRKYLPHGEPIVLIDQLVEVHYPSEIQDYLSGKSDSIIDQTKLVGTKIHTSSTLKPDNFWLDKKVLPSSILSELVAQAGALTLAPFFTGAKPEVALLGCDTEFFALAKEGDTIDTFLELTRAKRLGKSSNMIIFKSECFVGDTKIAQVSLNAMATF